MHTAHTLRIGLFDSGVGGLTVYKELASRLVNDSFIYFGDTARFPYGGKSPETIIKYSIENSLFLLQKEIDLLIVACNTASCFSLSTLQSQFDIPVFGVIEAAARSATTHTRSGKIGIIGTRGTISSHVYQNHLKAFLPSCHITALACPLLVSIIEENYRNQEVTRQVVKDYLKPLKDADVDILLLGCTHYPLLQHLFQEEMGEKVRIINPASVLAEEVSHKRSAFLSAASAKKETEKGSSFFVSDDPERFKEISSLFLGRPIDQVEKYLL